LKDRQQRILSQVSHMTEESRVSAPDPRVEPVSCHIELNFELS